MVWVPTVSGEIAIVPTPLASKYCGPSRLSPLSRNCTVPGGVPPFEVTVAVKVTLWVKRDGLFDDKTLVAVTALTLASKNVTVGKPVPKAVERPANIWYGTPASP